MLNQYKKKNFLLVSIFGFFTKKGKKELAKKVFQKALIKTSKYLYFNSFLILNFVFQRLQTSVEVRNVKKRRAIFKIPFFVSKKRQKSLSFR